jgi:hypothetical protein
VPLPIPAEINALAALHREARPRALQLPLMADFKTDPIPKKGAKENIGQRSMFDDLPPDPDADIRVELDQ